MKSAGTPDENIRDILSTLPAEDANAVRPLLLSLHSLSQDAAPAPSAELEGLLTGNASTGVVNPRRIHRRTLVFSLALIGALGAGAGTAAAVSPEFRSGAAHAIDGILNAIPFGPHAVVHPAPSGPPTLVQTSGPPAEGSGASHRTPLPGAPTSSHGNGKPSSGHATPKSTSHPSPPAKGHGTGAP